MIWLVSASLIWAFSFGLIKSKTSAIDPFVLGAARTMVAALFFLPWFLRKSQVATPRQTYLRAAFSGFIQIGLMYGPYLLSFRYLKSHEVALFTMTTPIIMALLLGIQHRHISWRLLMAALIATAGGIFAAGGQLTSAETMNGFILVQISNLLFASGLIIWNKWIVDVKSEQAKLMFPFFLGATCASHITAFFFAKDVRLFATDEWIVIIYLGVVASGLGFFLWNKGALQVTTGVLSVANNLKLPIAMMVSLTVFGESANLINLLGGTALVALGLKLAAPPVLRQTTK